MNDYIDLLWKYYKDDKDYFCRDKLLCYYSPFIKKIAKNIYCNLPNTIQLSEIESYSNMGFLDAMEKYDYKRGVKFETYARIRIMGAVNDELRKQDWVPRSIRSVFKKQKNKSNNGDDMEQKNKEICNNDSNFSLLQDEMFLDNGYMLSLDFYKDSLNIDLDIETVDFVEELEKKVSVQKLLMKLKKIERKVVYLYYFEGQTFKEIGKALNLTESRISQIHKKALAFLKKFINDFYL